MMSSAQVGKALAIDTPIATPNGWSTMGDIAVGDIVFDENGKQCNVTAVTGVQKDRECFSIIFSDGSEIIADADHRWAVEPDDRDNCVLTTREMLGDFKYGAKKHRNRYAIPVAGPIETEKKNLPIDPWTLGAWLGDGHSISARIFCHESDTNHIKSMVELAGYSTQVDVDGCDIIRIDPKDRDICPRGHDKNITGSIGKNYGCAECGRMFSKNHQRVSRGVEPHKMDDIVMTFSRTLAEHNLLGNKHIPDVYLRSSIQQRSDLLKGLMDTDGTIGEKGRCEFVTTSETIAKGMTELLHSLGIKHTVNIKKPTCTYKGKLVYGAEAYRFSFLAYKDQPVFSMPRKLNRMVSSENRRASETKRRRIVSIAPVESVPVKCISVDSPNNLYLAGEAMIPTHNTELLLNVIGYFIDYDPAPILLLQPTLSMAEAFSKDRLAPMLRDTPALKSKVKDARARDSGNTVAHKTFDGGHITMSGANSPASLASRPIRIYLADEIDRYPISAGTEGDPLKLGEKRTTTFFNRKKVYTSTPTVKGASRIEYAYEKSDMRRYYVPCSECGELDTFKWKNVKWDKDEKGEHLPETAYMVCEHCGAIHHDHDKIKRMQEGGVWIAEKPTRNAAGFHLNELYSPWKRWAEVVQDFLDAKDDTEQLKTWTNTSLGETWEEKGDQIDEHMLYKRREEFPAQVPAGAVVLTMGVDVQADRLECEVVGWSDGYENWSVDYRVIRGDTTDQMVWDELTELLDYEYEHESGNILSIAATGIDSGYNTQTVYDYVKQHEHRRVYAFKGVEGGGKPIVSRSAAKNKNSKRKVDLYLIGVDDAKATMQKRLQKQSVGKGYCHFPLERDEEYFAQLTAEKMVTKFRRGFPYREWVKTRARNEATDCRVYATASMHLLNPNWQALEARLEPSEEDQQQEKEIVETVTQQHMKRVRKKPGKRGFVKGWGR